MNKALSVLLTSMLASCFLLSFSALHNSVAAEDSDGDAVEANENSGFAVNSIVTRKVTGEFVIGETIVTAFGSVLYVGKITPTSATVVHGTRTTRYAVEVETDVPTPVAVGEGERKMCVILLHANGSDTISVDEMPRMCGRSN